MNLKPLRYKDSVKRIYFKFHIRTKKMSPKRKTFIQIYDVLDLVIRFLVPTWHRQL